MLKHLSFSSIKAFQSCPSAWAAKYLDGHKEEAGSAADFGNQFESHVAVMNGWKAEKYKGPTPEIEEAYGNYAETFIKWRGSESIKYQVELKISTEQWAEKAEELDANPEMPYPLLGYIDFLKLGLAPEVLDLKTRARLELKPDDITQTVFYTIFAPANRYTIHMYGTQTGKIKIESRKVTRELQRETMDTLAYYAGLIKNVVETRPPLAKLPGYHCAWCPLRTMLHENKPACAIASCL